MRLIISFAALLLSVALLQLGSGGLAPLDALSGVALNFSTGEIGMLGSAGLTMSGLDRLASADELSSKATAKSAIFIELPGGPSHIDTFDLKPNAAAEFRGLFNPIKTNVPGIEICEHLPKLAKQADKFSIIRGVSHTLGAHPLGQEFSRSVVDDVAADGGHAARAEGRDAFEQDRAFRGSRGDQAGVGEAEVALGRGDSEQAGLGEGGAEAQVDAGVAGAVGLVAHGAVDVQVRSGAQVQVRRFVCGIDKSVGLIGIENVFRMVDSVSGNRSLLGRSLCSFFVCSEMDPFCPFCL